MLNKLRFFIIKLIFYCYIKFWQLRAKYGRNSIIKDKILYPLKPGPTNYPKITENIGNELLNRMEKNLHQKGDYECLINGFYKLEGKTSSCGVQSKHLSDIIKDSR